MKKLIGAVVILALAGGAAYAAFHSPEKSACMKVGDLCGVQGGTAKDLDQCVDDIKQFRKVAGDEATDKGLKCVNEAKSCGEATGCIAGAGLKGMEGTVNDFLKGLGKAAN